MTSLMITFSGVEDGVDSGQSLIEITFRLLTGETEENPATRQSGIELTCFHITDLKFATITGIG